MAELKNTDKQVVGVWAYDIVNDRWGTIIEVEDDKITLQNEHYMESKWSTERENVYPEATNCILNIDKNEKVCYEVLAEVDYQYYVPEYDENFFDFEVTLKSEKKDPTNYIDNMVVTLCEEIARDLQAIIVRTEDEDHYGTAYMYFLGCLKEEAKNDKVAFIKKYVGYEPMNVYSDIISALANSAFTVLIPCEIAEKIDTKTREAIADKVNSLSIRDLIHLDTTATDSVWLADMRKKLDVEKYVHPKKKYNIEAIVTSKYIVKVEAENFEKAKDLAWEMLKKYPIFGETDVELQESEPKIEHWSKKK